ncbi:MAG TPA: redoxin domain-containing protein [Planctomycetaceae bacterium]|jgi:peroxiredoxin|nr:redoxin domain-containing protein [Planctomycetaceae bacterium]
MLICPIAAKIALLTALAAAAPKHPTVPPIGSPVADFCAQDCLGASHCLADLAHGEIVVLAFVGVECPLAKLYSTRIVQLSGKYKSRGTVFVGIDSNRQDGLSEITAFVRDNGIPFPVLKDLRQRIAERVGATRTPQVVVLDHDRRIRYRGRIDDQFGFDPANHAASYHKPHPHQMDLERALDELIANRAVSVPETNAAGCLIGRDLEPDARSKMTYTKEVAPILNRKCVSCHRPGQIGPFSLTSYDEVAGWADMIVEVTQAGRMPPWHADPAYGHFQNDARLSDEEKRALSSWAAAGAPLGDPEALLELPKCEEGWTIPKPDQVVYMSEQPFDVPENGVLDLQNFVVDPSWQEDRWITAIEPRPGNASVVHHILIFVLPPEGDQPDLRGDDCFLMAYAPGFRPAPLPSGYARHIKAGSKLIFNVHYTPNGRPQKDRSYVGVKFTESKTVRRETTICAAFNRDFQIPPGATNYEVRSQYVFGRDSLLLTLTPHMHLRGRDFQYQALYPDGRRETLLSVPRYDFNWQTMYQLAEPKLMPKGTVLSCVAHFDNSARNQNNPNPAAAVVFGWQSFEEMMVGFFDAAPAEEASISDSSLSFALRLPFSTYDILTIVTTINLFILAVLVIRTIRNK